MSDEEKSATVIDAEVVEDSGALATITESESEINQQIATAHRFPRSLQRFKEDCVAMATVDRETAEQCYYSLRRQGKPIVGPSIRLAEIAMACYGNLRTGARILGESKDGKFIVAQGVCHDLERNNFVSLEVTRRITTKDGRRYSDDMVGVTAAAAASLALRNAALRVIPRALIKPAFEAAKKVAAGNAKTHEERVAYAIERLAALDNTITEARVLAHLGRARLGDITGDDLTHLIGLGTAIKEGALTAADAFPDEGTPVETVKRGSKKKQSSKDERATLSPSQIETLRSLADTAGVSWDQLVGEFCGGEIESWTVEGCTARDLERRLVAGIHELEKGE